jgi:hypothetical protein
VKLAQKISGGWRTLPGAQAFIAVRSYVATARKHSVNVLHALRRAFKATPGCPQPPAHRSTSQLQPDIPIPRHRGTSAYPPT